MNDSTPTTYRLVEDETQFKALCANWLSCPALAIDTEFVRTRTFYPDLGLLQIFDGCVAWLIDCVAVRDLSPLALVLTSPGVMKVFHAPGEDLEILYHVLGVTVSPLFDVQLATAFLGEGSALSLQALCEQQLGVLLHKGQARSDWMARPLSPEQLLYAAEDVVHLLKIYQQLSARLQEKGRLGWVLEEAQRYLQQMVDHENRVDMYYQRLGQAALLDHQRQYVLQQLTIWREKLARKLNLTRNRLIPDSSLIALAERLPQSLPELGGIPDLHPQAIRKYGDQLLGIVSTSLVQPRETWPSRLPKPLTPARGKVLKALKARVTALAERWRIAPTVLLRRADYQSVMHSRDSRGVYHWPDELNDWRKALLADPVLQFLNETKAHE